jgi:outer membrane protein TolC
MNNRSIPIFAGKWLRRVAPRLFALATLGAACIAWAQPVHSAVKHAATSVTLAQAIAHGKALRLSVRIAQAEVDAARARLNQARALQWPSLDLTANLSDINNYDSFSGATASALFPGDTSPTAIAVTQTIPRYQASGGLQLRYDVYTGGRINAQISRQQQAFLAAQVKRQIALRDVALEIAQVYFKLRRACIKYDTARQNTQQAMESLQRARQRLRNGTIAALEVSEAELVLTEKQVALRTSNEDLEIAQADFAASQNMPPNATDAASNCNFTSDISADLALIETLAHPALEIQYDQLRVKSAQKTVHVERAAFMPQVRLSAQYTGIGRSVSSYPSAFDDFARGQASIGLDFSIKLFDGGFTQNRIAEAQAEAKRLTLIAKQNASERAQTRNRNALRVLIAQNHVELTRARFELAQKQSTIASARQGSGSGSAVAVDQQTERLRNAQDEYRLAQLDLALARIATLLPGTRTQPGATNTPDINDDKENSNHG